MSERRTEDARLLRSVLIHPCDDEVINLVADILRPPRDRPRGVEQLEVVVQLFIDGRPILQPLRKRTDFALTPRSGFAGRGAGREGFLFSHWFLRTTKTLHDRMLGRDERDVDRLLWPVSGRLQPDELEPIVGPRPVAVHRAVQVDRRNTVLVGVQDVPDIRLLRHIGRAFVVNDHVVALGPVGIVVDVEPRLGALVGRVDDRHLGHHARFDPAFEDVLLLRIVVTAASQNQQCLQRLGPRADSVLCGKFNGARDHSGQQQERAANQSAHRTSVLGDRE